MIKTTTIAEYIIRTKCTIRQAAKEFNIPKSTLHVRLTKLKYSKPALYKRLKKIFDFNFMEKSSRGGISTSILYAKAKEK